METVSVRFEEDFVEDMEKVMKGHRYATKTEFIREAVREKMNELEKQEALLWVERIYGAGAKKGRKITNANIHKVREQIAREIAKELEIKS